MKELWELFSSFARIGGFTFGGGYAMLPMLQKEVVEKRQWATEDEMLDYFAIGQCTPGVIFINTATFIGYKQKGIPGAIAATVGSVFPSLCIVMFIAAVLKNFAELAVVQHAFAGIRVVVSVLILNAVMGLRKKSIVDKLCVVIAAASFLVSVWVDISPVWIVLAAAISSTYSLRFSLRIPVSIIERSAATVVSRSSHKITGRPQRFSSISLNSFVFSQRSPSVLFIFFG